jgi:hypothetical protein
MTSRRWREVTSVNMRRRDLHKILKKRPLFTFWRVPFALETRYQRRPGAAIAAAGLLQAVASSDGRSGFVNVNVSNSHARVGCGKLGSKPRSNRNACSGSDFRFRFSADCPDECRIQIRGRFSFPITCFRQLPLKPSATDLVALGSEC